MLKLFSNKKLIMLLLGLIFFIMLMGFTLGQRNAITWPEKFIKDTVSWTQGIFYKPARAIAGFFEDIRQMSTIYEENETLRRTLQHYARDTVRLNDLEAQNKRLKEALNFTENQKQSNEYKWHIAEIVGMSPEPLNNTVTVNLGEKNGIKENMAVMSVDGLVGMVVKVFPFYSNVQLLTDLDEQSNTSKAVAATVQGKEDKSFGIIESFDRETGLLIMTKIAQNDELAVGDTVVTSGLGQVFPRGIVVGKVVSREEGNFGLTHTAQIKPAANFEANRLRELFLVEVPNMR